VDRSVFVYDNPVGLSKFISDSNASDQSS